MMYAEICRDVFAPVYSVEDKPRLFGGNLRKTFAAKLVSSLVQDIGTGTPTFSRADATSCATVTDFEGIVRVVPANCARFMGARIVRNLLAKTEALTDAAWLKLNGGTGVSPVATDAYASAPNGTMTASRLQLNRGAGNTGSDYSIFYQNPTAGLSVHSVWMRSNTGSTQYVGFGNTSGTYISASVTTAWQEFSLSDTPGGAYTLFSRGIYSGATNSIDILVWHPQYELTSGQANQNPSEYVSVGVLAAPYHGAGVDGIKYFPYLNGNTVASNVVTEAVGASIKQGVAGVSATAPVDAIGPYGYLAEGSRQNLLLNSDIIGTNLSTQSITVTAAPWTVSFTGTGTITFTGTYTGSLVGSGATTRVQTTFTPTAGSLTCTVTGTVKYAQAELGSLASSFVPTAASAVTRAADVLTYPSAGNVSGTVGTLYCEVSTANASAVNLQLVTDANGRGLDYWGGVDVRLYDGVNYYGGVGSVATTPTKIAASYGGTTALLAKGATAANGGFTPFAWVNNIQIATYSVATFGLFGTVRNVRIYPTALTAAQLKALTA